MITREQIPTVLDHPVYDTDGNKIGDARHVFFDDVTGEPEWVSVSTGLFGTSESFVPIHDATVVKDHLEVPFDKSRVKDAPNVDVDAGGHLSEQEEHRLYEHYGIDWDTAWQQTDQSGQADQPGQAGRAHSGTNETTGMPRAGYADTGVGGDDAMTRSEERMNVGTERREAGRARLRKYVITEEVQQTVPVRREKVRVEREPITDDNRDAALSGPDITEAEHEVILHEERPVTETETVPVERVRMTTEERTDEETVRGQVRKEHIDTEGVEERRDR
jgi:stress response protein YsnF